MKIHRGIPATAAAFFVTVFLSTTHAAEGEVVVTASRVAETADASLASVTIITREDIERTQPKDMAELLRSVPGVDLARTGGPGSGISLFLRGSNSNHTLVLIDGVRASSASSGAFAWETLAPSQIERVEVVRGPRAALYGSDAIGGVIQIFTRQPQSLTARIEAGSYGTSGVQVGMAAGEKTRLTLAAEHRSSDGFSATNPRIDTTAFCPPFCSFDPDNDGYESSTVSASLERAVSAQGKLLLRAWLADSENDFDDGAGNLANTTNRNRVVSMRYDHNVSDDWSAIFSLGHSSDDQDNQTSNPFSSSSHIETQRLSFDWQNDIAISDKALLTVGLNYYQDDVRNTDTTTLTNVYKGDIDNQAIYVSYQRHLDAHDLNVSIRRDDHSEFGSENTHQIGWGYTFPDDTRITVSYGSAFRAPTLNELFHPGFGGFFAGNPLLNPETAKSWEIGLRFAPSSKERIAFALYRNNIEDLIAYEGTNFQAVNIASATTRGIEASYTKRSDRWIADLSLTLQRARNNTTDEPLLRRPGQKASLSLTRKFGSTAHAGGELVLSSEAEDVGPITLAGYGVLNLFADYQIDRAWRLELRADNILDKQYQVVNGYNTPGRSVNVALRYTPALK